MTTHSSILAQKIPWTKEPGGFIPWACRVGHDQVPEHAHAQDHQSLESVRPLVLPVQLFVKHYPIRAIRMLVREDVNGIAVFIPRPSRMSSSGESVSHEIARATPFRIPVSVLFFTQFVFSAQRPVVANIVFLLPSISTIYHSDQKQPGQSKSVCFS